MIFIEIGMPYNSLICVGISRVTAFERFGCKRHFVAEEGSVHSTQQQQNDSGIAIIRIPPTKRRENSATTAHDSNIDLQISKITNNRTIFIYYYRYFHGINENRFRFNQNTWKKPTTNHFAFVASDFSCSKESNQCK